MLSKSVHWLFNAGWLRGSLSPTFARSQASLYFPHPSVDPYHLDVYLHYTIDLSLMAVMAAGTSSGSLSRVLQSPLSHTELYGMEYPLQRQDRRAKKMRKISSKGGKGGKVLRGKSTRTGGPSSCSVNGTTAGKRSKKAKSKESPEPIHTVTKNKIFKAAEDAEGMKRKTLLTQSTHKIQSPKIFHSQRQHSSSSMLPPVEADSPQTVKRTAAKPRPARGSLSRSSSKTVLGKARGAWLAERNSFSRSLPVGARKVSGGSRSDRDVVLLSETESVSLIRSSLTSPTHPGSSVSCYGGRKPLSGATQVTTTGAKFSHWSNRSTNSSSKSLGASRRTTHMTTSSLSSWGRGREGGGGGRGGGRRQLELEDITVGLGRMDFRNVIVMSGAGISTPSGIPDFRTPGSGLYDNLQKYQLPEPSAIFDTAYFHRNPQPFFSLAKELYPGRFCPSLAHCFLRLLQDKGVLLRSYTQNIDGLERLAGVEGGKLVEAHGSFSTASCTRCHSKQDPEEVKTAIFDDQIPVCKHRFCKGVVKPDIVFFGEDLPQRFYSLQLRDFSKCDLLLVMGTSLEVEPFASLVTLSGHSVPRLLLNRELVGPFQLRRRRSTDVAVCRDVEESVRQLAQGAGWEHSLNNIHKEVTSRMNVGAVPRPVAVSVKSRATGGECSQLTTAMDKLTLQQDTPASTYSPDSPSSSTSSSSSSESSSSSSSSSTSHISNDSSSSFSSH